jgi:hypothetical protein
VRRREHRSVRRYGGSRPSIRIGVELKEVVVERRLIDACGHELGVTTMAAYGDGMVGAGRYD